MNFPRILLGLVALVYAGFGVAFLAAPAEVLELVNVRVATPTARADVRAQYGGFQVGFALFLFVCLASPNRTAVGLLASALTLGGFAIARLTSALTDGPVEPVIYGLAAAEGSGAILSAVAWLAVRRTEPPVATEDW